MGKVLIRKSFPPYSTSFPLTENPLRESGKWIDGLAPGLDWYGCKTLGGNVVGVQSSGGYTDPTSILTGTWAPNQRVRCTVFKNAPSSSYLPEMEIRLRSVISAHVNRGYECLISLYNLYSPQIVRWNGDLGDFTYINDNPLLTPTPVDGDIFEAEIIGGHIKVFLNSNLVVEADDSTWTDGNPGIGFFTSGGDLSEQEKWGFKDFQAWEL
jgi:hypothetical protein